MTFQRRGRASWSAVVVGVVCAVVTACSSGGGNTGDGNSGDGTGSQGSGSAGKPQRGGDLVFARPADNTSLDPIVTGDNESIWTNEQIFETLYTVSANGKDVRPWLATSYTRSKDNTKFTFQLRKGVQFSNGKAMTADDVAWSINRARTSGEGLTYIDGAIKDVTAQGPSTVVVTTKYPWAPLVADIALFVNGVMPANFGGVSEKEFFQHPVGTGPFMLDEWKHGDMLKLVRNPHYWQKGKPYLDSVTFTNVSDENQRMVQLRGGQAQIIRFPPFSALESLDADPNIVAEAFPSTRVDYLLMNQKVKPYDDPHVRRAISYALDRESMVKALLFGHGDPADSFLAPTEAYYQPNAEALSFDLAMAKQEMAASSVPNGFSTTFLTSQGDRIPEIVQQALQPLGIKISIKSVDINQIFEIQGKGDYEITDEYWTEDIPDPDERTAWFLNQAASNDYFTYYDNKELTTLVQQSEQTFDETERAALYKQIQEIQATELPQIPLYYSPYQYAYASTVQGFTVSPLGNFHLEDVWLK